MGDSGDAPDSPPLPKGSYNFNFDDLDSMDPFKSQGGLMLSPGEAKDNPFVSKSKLSSSPPIHAADTHVNADAAEYDVDDVEEAESPEFNDTHADIDTGVDNLEVEPPEYQAENPIDDDFPPPPDESELPIDDYIESEREHCQSEAIDITNVGDPFQTKTKMAQSPPATFDEDINPFQTKPKMGFSPPAHSEEENAFQTKSKIGQSPPVNALEENPFQTKGKLSQSPPSDSGFSESIVESVENPFQTKCKLGQSSPQHDMDNSVECSDNSHDPSVQNNEAESLKPTDESPDKSNTKGFKTKAKSPSPQSTAILDDADQGAVRDTTGNDDCATQVPAKPSPKKATTQRKSGLKKPKARSKFKPPANFGVQDDGDGVEIFAPPSQPNQFQCANEDQLQDGDQPIIDSCESNSANQMTVSEIVGGVSDMIDSVHDFGATEMPMERNEEFVPASEAFNGSEAWDMMEQMVSGETVAPRDSLIPFDPLLEGHQVPDKASVTRRSSDPATETDANTVCDDDDLLLMNTPPAQKQSTTRSVARHPAARALQQEVGGDGAPREAHVVDKMLFSPPRGLDGKLIPEGDDRYFDALEYPLGNRRTQKKKGKGDQGDVDQHMNAGNKKQPADNHDNIVQLVQEAPSVGHINQVLKYSQSDWNKMRQDLELDHNARILNKEREWSKKLADRDKKISYLDEQVLLLRSSNEDMKLVVTEFEKTIAQLQAEKVKTTSESQQNFEDTIKERDQALEDLQSVETAFSDLHQRYERTKGVVEGFKKNEEMLKKCVVDYQGKLKTAEEKTMSVRQQAEDKLTMASDEMDKLRRSTTAEVARLEAGFKKAELKIAGLERSLDQKVQENSELTAICDELIAKVGD